MKRIVMVFGCALLVCGFANAQDQKTRQREEKALAWRIVWRAGNAGRRRDVRGSYERRAVFGAAN